MPDDDYTTANDEYTEDYYDIAVWRPTTDGYEWDPMGYEYKLSALAEVEEHLRRKRQSHFNNKPATDFRIIRVQKTIKSTEVPS